MLADFQCQQCQIVIERIVKDTKEVIRCEVCDVKMVRLISKSSFVLKGKGWGDDGYQK